MYFAEMADAPPAERWQFIDYNLSRKFYRGDQSLFRPITHGLLLAEYHLFGPNHFLWNVANFGLHLLVVFLLYRLLSSLSPGISAWLFTALFSVLKGNVELVTWNHLGGYLLAFSFLLIALKSRRVIAITPAIFAYEPIGIFSIVLAAYRRRAVYLLPLLVFIALYAIRATLCEDIFYADHKTIGAGFHPIDIVRAGASYLVLGLLPAAVHVWAPVYYRYGAHFQGTVFSWSYVLNGLLALAAIIRLVPGARPDRFAAAMGSLILIYLTILVVGRTIDDVRGNTYYAYLFFLLATIFLYSLLPHRRGAFVLAGLILLNTWLTHTVTRDVARTHAEADAYLTALDEFVATEGATFNADSVPLSVDPSVLLRRGYNNDLEAPTEHRRLSQILYPAHYASQNPRFTLQWESHKLILK